MITTKSPTLNRLLRTPLHMAVLATLVSLLMAAVINTLFLSPQSLAMTLIITLVIAAPMSYLTIKLVFDMRTTIVTQKVKLALEHERADILAKFMRDAAHEFKTPLTLMATNLYLGERATETDKKQNYMRHVKEQIHTLNTLLDTILILTRLDSTDKNVYQRERVNASELVMPLYALRDNNGRLEIIAEQIDTLPHIYVNLSDLHLVFKQIVENALRYSPADSPVSMQFSSSGQGILVEVRDRGHGMNPETIQHIFDRFYRADESHTTRGLGLGLAIAKRVIELHDGHIEIESEIGNGTTVKTYIPSNQP